MNIYDEITRCIRLWLPFDNVKVSKILSEMLYIIEAMDSTRAMDRRHIMEGGASILSPLSQTEAHELEGSSPSSWHECVLVLGPVDCWWSLQPYKSPQ